MTLQPRTRTTLAWSLWLASMGCCAGGLLAALLWVRPLTLGTLAGGAATALAFPVGYATVGGERVAISEQRSTRGREVLSSLFFADLTTTASPPHSRSCARRTASN